MKSAIVHDWLLQNAGAEKVVKEMLDCYPSTIYTLFDKSYLFSDVKTSFLQKIPLIEKFYQHLLPIYPYAIEQLDVKDADLIISSSHAVAKGIITRSDQCHICYCHTPMRYLWDLTFTYLKQKGFLTKYLVHKLRAWDVLSSMKVDYFIANSEYVRKRIQKTYRRDAKVIYPPVDTSFFSLETKKEDFFVTAGRLVSYKNTRVILEAFAHLPKQKLYVLGDGPERKKLEKMATKNVTFLGKVSDETLKIYLQKAKGFIFMSDEDFGILPVEAMSTGTPVIALDKGGCRETVLPNKTGVLVCHEKLKDAIKAFKPFDPEVVSEHAASFSKERFREELKSFIGESFEDYHSSRWCRE